MKTTFKNIIPGIGLGSLKFGMTRPEVSEALGKPEEVDAYSYTETKSDLTETWYYNELELTLGFDEEDEWKLGSIAIRSNHYLLEEKELIGLERTIVEKTLNDLKYYNLEHEDCSTADDPNHELVAYDAKSINFWFDDDILTEIQWSPLFLDDETIIWPK